MSDSFTSALSSIGSSPVTKGALDAAQLGSTGYGLYNTYQNQQYQNQLRSYAQNPQKMNQYAAQFTQPLTAGLTTGVENNAQAKLAQSGLSDSPQIAQQVYAQALAPSIQQNQNQGYQNALSALNLGGGAQTSNTGTALAKAFSQLGGVSGDLSGLGKLQRLLTLANSGATPQQTPVDAGTSPIAEIPMESMPLPTYTDTQSATPSTETFTPDYIGSYGLGQ